MNIFNFENLIKIVLAVSFCPILFYIIQYFLSKANKAWYGKILPILSVVFSILASISCTLFIYMKPLNYNDRSGSFVEIVITGLVLFLIWNIPTFVYILIYHICKKQIQNNYLV